MAGQLTGQRTVAGDHGGAVIIGVDQRIQGHQQLQFNIDICGSCLAGESFHQGVGHDLIPGPAITGGDGRIGVLL